MKVKKHINIGAHDKEAKLSGKLDISFHHINVKFISRLRYQIKN